MSEQTNIAWATHTASPWFGCSKVSAGCTHAETLTPRHGWAGWGDKAPRVRSVGFWKEAYKWNKKAICRICGHLEFIGSDDCRHCGTNFSVTNRVRPRVFPSLMDWLDPKVPTDWLAAFIAVIRQCNNLDWLLLTKRPELFKERLTLARKSSPDGDTSNFMERWQEGNSPPHVWVGVSVENQATADGRIPILLSIPARVRWLSVEPLLSQMNLRLSYTETEDDLKKSVAAHKRGELAPVIVPGLVWKRPIDWVVVGGESGQRRRDCGVEAIINVAEQCKADGVPCFVNQDCAARPGQQGRIPDAIWNLKQYPK